MPSRDPLILQDPFWTWHRALSALLAAIEITVAGIVGGRRGLTTMMLFVPLPMLCIWLPHILDEIVLMNFNRVSSVVRPSHAGVVRALGWVLLLFPAFIAALDLSR